MVRKVFVLRIFLLLLISPLVSCTHLFYFPRVSKVKFYDPSKVGLKQEEIEFPDEEGTMLHGWWFSATTKEPAKGTIVFFHGNGENLTTHFLSLSWIPERGYNYFIFDYPEYGVSQGEISQRTTVLAGRAAIRWVHKNKDPKPLVVFAQSLGGNIGYRCVLDLKEEIPFRALIVDSSFLSYSSIARAKASESWITWIFQPIVWLATSNQYAPKDLEKRAPIPLLVAHGQEDTIIPPRFGDEIFEKSAEPKEMWKIEHGRHGDIFWRHGQVYRDKFLEYLERHP